MKIIRICAIICLSTALCAFPALAGGLSARMDGSDIVAAWQVGMGSGELTVSQSGWPICVRQVAGGSGSTRVHVDDPEGSYDLRLMISGSSYIFRIQGTAQDAIQTAAPKPTEAVASVRRLSGQYRDNLAQQAIRLINEERAARGLAPLKVSGVLMEAARVRAQEISRSFGHTRPDGTSWATVSGSAYAENIARGQRSAEKVVAAWMTSANHRANILRESYRSVGIAAYVSGGVVHWAQLFGK